MSTPLQRIQLGLLLGSLTPGGLVGVLLLVLFVPFAVVAVVYSTVNSVKEEFQASHSAIISEIEANGAGDLWKQLAPLELGQWFYQRPAMAARIVRECDARNVLRRAEENRWGGSPEERVCYSAAHPIPLPVFIKEPSE